MSAIRRRCPRRLFDRRARRHRSIKIRRIGRFLRRRLQSRRLIARLRLRKSLLLIFLWRCGCWFCASSAAAAPCAGGACTFVPGRPRCRLSASFFKFFPIDLRRFARRNPVLIRKHLRIRTPRQFLLIRRQLQKRRVLRRSASVVIARSTVRCGNSTINFSLFHSRMTTSKCRMTDSHAPRACAPAKDRPATGSEDAEHHRD